MYSFTFFSNRELKKKRRDKDVDISDYINALAGKYMF